MLIDLDFLVMSPESQHTTPDFVTFVDNVIPIVGTVKGFEAENKFKEDLFLNTLKETQTCDKELLKKSVIQQSLYSI